MNRVKKTISVILVILMVLALISSCATKSSSTDSDIPGTPDTNDASPSASQGLVVTSPEEISADPEANYAEELMVVIDNNPIVDFLPHSSSAGTSSTLWAENMIYDRLVGIDADGKYIPALALSWETDDWQTITMKLRDDVTFHSGEKFTASDVVFTINDAREATGTLSQEYWATVKEVTAIDDYTVKFVLDGVNVEFLYDCSQPWSSILSEKAMTEDPEKGYWIGTGAFMVSDFATSDYVELTRNDSYWGEKAITKTITLKYIPEESTRLMMLQNGEADACFSLNTNDYPVIENDPDNYNSVKYVSNNPWMISFNLDKPIMNDLNFRKAVAYAINRDEIVTAVMNGYGEPIETGCLWGYMTDYKASDIAGYSYDPEKAKEYLAMSSYNGETIELTTAINDIILTAAVVQEQLSKIGINVEINNMDIPGLVSYAAAGNNQSEMLCFLTAFTKSPSSTRACYYPGAASNRFGYNNPEVTALYDLAPTLLDENERAEAFHSIQKYIAEDLPIVPLVYRCALVATVKGVGGMQLWSDNNHDLRYMYKVIDQFNR